MRKVWIMVNNKPEQYMIYSVTEKMSIMKTDTDFHYGVVKGLMSAPTSGNPELFVGSEDMYNTKTELLESL